MPLKSFNLYLYEGLKSEDQYYKEISENSNEEFIQIRKFLNCISLVELNFAPIENLVYISYEQAKSDANLVKNEVDILSKTVEINNNPWWIRYRLLQKFLSMFCESDDVMFLTNMLDNFNNYDWVKESDLVYFGHNRHKKNKKTLLFYLDDYHTPEALAKNVVQKQIPFRSKRKSMISRLSTSGSLTKDNGWYHFNKVSDFAESKMVKDDICIAYNLCSNYLRFRFCYEYRKSDLIDCGFTNSNKLIRTHFPELLKDHLSLEEMCEYMFHICLGGNDWGSSLFWQLLNNNVVFIPYPFEFESIFTLGLIPYKHFVPVSNNLCDLDEKLHDMINNENLCFELASNAHEYIKQFLSSDFYELVGERIIKTYISKANAYNKQ